MGKNRIAGQWGKGASSYFLSEDTLMLDLAKELFPHL
jgi:hypothetical protein